MVYLCNIIKHKFFTLAMNSLLDKEPVKRAEKSIKEFDPSLESCLFRANS